MSNCLFEDREPQRLPGDQHGDWRAQLLVRRGRDGDDNVYRHYGGRDLELLNCRLRGHARPRYSERHVRGPGPRVTNLIPSDIEICHNLFSEPFPGGWAAQHMPASTGRAKSSSSPKAPNGCSSTTGIQAYDHPPVGPPPFPFNLHGVGNPAVRCSSRKSRTARSRPSPETFGEVA